MMTLVKSGVIVALLLALLCVGGAVVSFNKLTGLTEELHSKDEEISSIAEARDAAQEKEKEAVEEMTKLEKKSAELEEQIFSLKSKLDTSIEEKVDLEKKIAGHETTLASVRQELAKAKQMKQDAEALLEEKAAEIKKLQSDKDALLESISTLEEGRNELTRRVETLTVSSPQRPKTQAEIKPVRPDTTPSASPTTKKYTPKKAGKIQVVNKKFNFMVISLGKRDGIKPGDMCGVYRGESLLGRVKIEQVFEKHSSANIDKKLLPQAVSEGDVVKKL